MTNSINGEKLFANFSGKLNNLYKDKDVELSKSDMQNIFNAAIKSDKDGVIDVNDFLKAAQNYGAEKFSNCSFTEKTKQFEEFAQAYDEIGMLDGEEGVTITDIEKLNETGSEKLPESVFKGNKKIKTENNRHYVEVERYNDEAPDNNDCLSKIIKNNYDLEALGIKPGSKEYLIIEDAVMNENKQIFGNDEKEPVRGRIQDGKRHSSIMYAGDKLKLPDLYEIKEFREAGFERPEIKNEINNSDDKQNVPASTTSSNASNKSEPADYNSLYGAVEFMSYQEPGIGQMEDMRKKVANSNISAEEKIELNEMINKTEHAKGYVNIDRMSPGIKDGKNLGDSEFNKLYNKIEFMSYNEPGLKQTEDMRKEVANTNLPPLYKAELLEMINKTERANGYV